jgi:hypothetical protein
MTAIYRLLLVSAVVLPGCWTEHPSEPANRLIGDYVSTAFNVAGPNDAPVDVQAAGGSLQMTIRIDNSFSATVIIPQGVSTVIGSGTTNTYSGVFSLANDTLRINPSSFIVGGMIWDEGSSSLTATTSPRGGTHLTLKKLMAADPLRRQ